MQFLSILLAASTVALARGQTLPIVSTFSQANCTGPPLGTVSAIPEDGICQATPGSIALDMDPGMAPYCRVGIFETSNCDGADGGWSEDVPLSTSCVTCIPTDDDRLPWTANEEVLAQKTPASMLRYEIDSKGNEVRGTFFDLEGLAWGEDIPKQPQRRSVAQTQVSYRDEKRMLEFDEARDHETLLQIYCQATQLHASEHGKQFRLHKAIHRVIRQIGAYRDGERPDPAPKKRWRTCTAMVEKPAVLEAGAAQMLVAFAG
ncbi:hypothetical protein C8R47DRAFT_1078216 [Mycena vitilis]|nr:hypothetical protein C8R47DRAFT_1078216 [Mycena vitilis]